MRIIGIDCATDDAKTGVAFAVRSGSTVTVMDVVVCTRADSALDRAAAWISEASGPVLIAIDAPLGWPRAMGEALGGHRAGDEVLCKPNELFRRATDRHIQSRLGKTPLDVGADRIARTAHAALRLLGGLRSRLSVEIALAWDPHDVAKLSVIEVYPAATLLTHRIHSKGYKKPGDSAKRREMVTALAEDLVLPADVALLEANADALDAVACVLAAKDFLDGKAQPPEDAEVATHEGWIWA